MTTTLQKLLKYPHAAVFDKAPGAQLALRVRHPDGAKWTVADEVLTVTVGSVARTYDLKEFTVDGLVAELIADGFEIPYVSPDLGTKSALTLVEGSGDQNVSNGDRLTTFSSLLWVFLSGYAGEVREAEYQVQQALRQMVITQAEGEWLDVWGELYGDARITGESDATYAPRIPQEAFRQRVNARGIEKAIFDATGWDVRIQEPWQEVFTLDQSLLSGPDRFYNGDNFGYHLIRPVTRQSVDWDIVLKIINRNKAAGVIVVDAEVNRVGSLVDGSGSSYVFGVHTQHADLVPYEDRALLDFSEISEVSILNHESWRRRELRRFSQSIVTSQPWIDVPWFDVAWLDLDYIVGSRHSRDFRTFYFFAYYSSNFWNVGGFDWSPDRDWTSDVIIHSSHTSES